MACRICTDKCKYTWQSTINCDDTPPTWSTPTLISTTCATPCTSASSWTITTDDGGATYTATKVICGSRCKCSNAANCATPDTPDAPTEIPCEPRGECTCNDGDCCWNSDAYITGTYHIEAERWLTEGCTPNCTGSGDSTDHHTLSITYNFRATLLNLGLPDANGCCVFGAEGFWDGGSDPIPDGLTMVVDGFTAVPGGYPPNVGGATIRLAYKCSNRGCTGNWSAKGTSGSCNGPNIFPQGCFNDRTVYGCDGDGHWITLSTVPATCLSGSCTSIDDVTCSAVACSLDDYAGRVSYKILTESLTNMVIHNTCCRIDGTCHQGAECDGI